MRASVLRVRVHGDALKHGLGKEDILYAWDHRIATRYRDAPREGEVIAIGPDPRGRLLQMVGVEDWGDAVIIHAMSPPTRKMMNELGL